MKKEGKTKRVLFDIVIAFAIIAFWRGIWGLMDLYLFPDNYSLSLLTSAIIGLLIIVVITASTKNNLLSSI